MRRWISNMSLLLGLLLAVAGTCLWVRSYWTCDLIDWHRDDDITLSSNWGG